MLVTASKLHVRRSPKVDSIPIGLLDRGDIVQLLGESEDRRWRKVKLGPLLEGRLVMPSGWVSAKYLCMPELYPVELHKLETYPWMPIAISQIGVAEVDGPGSNPRINSYLQSCELLPDELQNDDSTPWCSGFVNWCVEMAGYAGSNSAAARSWLSWGEPLIRPVRGCITVLSRKGGHHVGFYLGKSAGQLRLLGGNQDNRVGPKDYDEGRLLGYRVAAKAGDRRKTAARR